MAYHALYREWRPKDFTHMVGQEAIVATLRHQVETGRVAHAYLFCGSRGTGKTSAAKIFARAINCLNPQHGDPCGECDVCRKSSSEEFMDILEFDAASNSRVEDARELLEKASFPPQIGAYKVYIIDEVHMLSNSAFNALLKTLEEPPEYLVFILATTEPYKLPATILSRCQRFDFGRIPAAQIQGRLIEATRGAGGEATNGALMMIARAAEGGMRDALSILDMCLGYGTIIDEKLVQTVLGTSDRAFLFRFSKALKEENAAQILQLINELLSSGKDPLVFTRDISAHLRNLILAKYCGNQAYDVLGVTEEDSEEYIRESTDISTSRLMNMMDLFMQMESEMRYSGSPRIALENVSLKCCLRTNETDNFALNERIDELEKQVNILQEQIRNGIHLPESGTKISFPEKKGKNTIKDMTENQRNAGKAIIQKTSSAENKDPKDIWENALKVLQKTEPGTQGMFRMGEYFGNEGSTFFWKARTGFDFIAQSLNTPDRKRKIEDALTHAAGFACTFVATDANVTSLQNDEEEYLQTLKETFGDEPVDVIDSLPK